MLKSILIGLLILASSSLISQSNYWSKTKIGFVAGPKFNVANVMGETGNTSYTFSDKGSFNTGVNMITKFSDKFALSYGITSTRNQFERKEICTSCDVTVATTSNLKYRYLNIPIQMQVYFQNDKLDIFGIAGVNYNLLTKSHGNYINATGNKFDIISMENETNNNLFGFEIGAGIDYNLSYRGSFRLNVTYQHYLNAFSTDPNASILGLSVQPGIFYQF